MATPKKIQAPKREQLTFDVGSAGVIKQFPALMKNFRVYSRYTSKDSVSLVVEGDTVRIEEELYLHSDADDLIDAINKFKEKVVGKVQLSGDYYQDYGDTDRYYRIDMSGFRAMTTEEKNECDHLRQLIKEYNDSRDRVNKAAEIARAKAVLKAAGEL